MRHLATYMLLVLGGNAAPTKEDVTKALSAVGVDVRNYISLMHEMIIPRSYLK